MADSRTQPPTVLFRAATLVGCAALLLGVAGLFYFGSRDRSWRDGLPADAATVLLQGLESDARIDVEVRWQFPGERMQSETGERSTRAGRWHFRKAPEGYPLRLLVYRRQAQGRKLLHEQHAIFTLGAGFEVIVRER